MKENELVCRLVIALQSAPGVIPKPSEQKGLAAAQIEWAEALCRELSRRGYVK